MLLFFLLTSALFQIPLAGNINSQQNMQHLWKGSPAILTSSPYKNKFQEDRKRKETRDHRKSSSKIRLQKKRQSDPSGADVSIIRGELDMKIVIILWLWRLWQPSLIETGEENSDSDTEYLYCSGPLAFPGVLVWGGGGWVGEGSTNSFGQRTGIWGR